MKRVIFYIAILLVCAAGSKTGRAVACEASRQVGLVVGLNAPSDHYHLIRKENGNIKEVEIDVFIALCENDEIRVNCRRDKKDGEENRIIIQLSDGEKVLTCKTTPYTLAGKSPYYMLNNFGVYLSELVDFFFGGLNDSYHSASLAALSVRGCDGPLNMSMVGHSEAYLTAGIRNLYLAWSGGYPPYTLHILKGQSKDHLAKVEGLEETRAKINEVALEPGEYSMEIEDSCGQRVRRRFQAILPEKLPAPPFHESGVASSNVEKQLWETIYAAWLIEQDPILWSLEAYQRISADCSGFYPAELLRLRLEGKL